MSISRHFVLAAGGTGGHMMPAHALAAELVARGHRVALVTDERGAKIPGLFDDVQTHILPAGRITRNPLSWPGGVRAILSGRGMALRLYEAFEPSAVMGFGGYPAFPALFAAHSAGIPTAVHEQNAVLGRVNRLVANRVRAIATAYPDVQRIAAKNLDKVHLVGNPVREEVLALRDYLLKGGFLWADDFWGEIAWQNFEQEMRKVLPAREKYSKIAGLWTGDVGQPNEICHLWAYPDLNARAAARGGSAKDPGWQAFLKSSGGMLEEMHSTVMLPAVHSPLK
mgnify:CR=1 FL=1